MNAKELLERFDFAGFNPHANDTVLRALRLLAAAEANDGSTPETDAEWRAMGDLARRLERERNALAARVLVLQKTADLYCLVVERAERLERMLEEREADKERYRSLIDATEINADHFKWLRDPKCTAAQVDEDMDAIFRPNAARSKP